MFATLLTLFVVPTLYSYYDSCLMFFARKRDRDNAGTVAAP